MVESNIVVLQRSGLENIDLDAKETCERSCIISGSQNCSIDLNSLTEEMIMPHGNCKVYRGKPQHNMWFNIKSGQEKSEYDILISDSASSNSFQVKLNNSILSIISEVGYKCLNSNLSRIMSNCGGNFVCLNIS